MTYTTKLALFHSHSHLARATRSPAIQPAPDEDSDERQKEDGRDERFEIHDH